MLSTKCSMKLLGRVFNRTAARYMSKESNTKWDEEELRKKKQFEQFVSESKPKADVTVAKQNRMKPEQIGVGGKFVDQRHLKGPEKEDPVKRTIRILKDDMKDLKDYFPFSLFARDPKNRNLGKHFLPNINDMVYVTPSSDENDLKFFPTHVDIAIIGGGAMGSAIAYFLKERARHGLSIVVIEKDKSYAESSTTLSVGGLRQQFSLEENIQMSLYGAEFLRTIKERLGEHVDVHFQPCGYLYLASEAGAEQLQANSVLQNRLGAKNITLTANKLKARFPWLNTDGIALGCYGLEKEGWFDPWSLLMAFKHKAQHLGVRYVDGEVINFEMEAKPGRTVIGVPEGECIGTNKLLVKTAEGEVQRITFASCIIAAGAQSGNVARLANIGTGEGILSVPLPVEPRKRYVYSIKTQGDNAPPLNSPLTIDPTSTYFRRDGLDGNYLVGRSPDPDCEPCCDNLDVDYNYFDDVVWPKIAHRVPAFESAKVVSAWSGYYEYNTFDANGIVGLHPYYPNMFIATGFSGHGIQQAPAIGRAISELILDGHYTTIDLDRLNYDRFIVNEPMLERNIV